MKLNVTKYLNKFIILFYFALFLLLTLINIKTAYPKPHHLEGQWIINKHPSIISKNSNSHKKEVLLYAGSKNCLSCLRFEREVLSNKDVQEKLKNFSCYYLDYEVIENNDFLKSLNIKSYPTFIISSKKMRKLEGDSSLNNFLLFLDDKEKQKEDEKLSEYELKTQIKSYLNLNDDELGKKLDSLIEIFALFQDKTKEKHEYIFVKEISSRLLLLEENSKILPKQKMYLFLIYSLFTKEERPLLFLKNQDIKSRAEKLSSYFEENKDDLSLKMMRKIIQKI